MGWLYRRLTREQLVAELVAAHQTDSVRFETLEHTVVGDVLWALVRVTALRDDATTLAKGESTKYIRCILLNGSPEGWGYKAMDESVHPYYYSCPLHYLVQAVELSPEWRAGVRKHHLQDEVAPALPSFVGDLSRQGQGVASLGG